MFLAAWIICHHLIRWLARGNELVASDFGVLRQGQAATSGFFVLGGLGLYWAYGEKLAVRATLESWGSYLRRRWAAVAPLGLLGAMIAIPYEIEANIMNGRELVGAFVANALLLQAWIPTGGGEHGVSLRFDGPTWTLSALLLAYAVFPVAALFIHRRIGTRLGLLAFAFIPYALVVGATFAFHGQPGAVYLLHVHPVVRLMDVLVGVAIGAWLVRYGRPGRRAGWALQVAAVVAVVGSAWLAVRTDLGRETYFGAWYVPCMALLAIALSAEGGPLVRLFAWKPLERPGRVAFAMLMLHVPFISWGWYHGLVSPDRPWVVAALLATCLAISWVVHLKVERPLVRRIAGSSSATAATPVAAQAAAGGAGVVR